MTSHGSYYPLFRYLMLAAFENFSHYTRQSSFHAFWAMGLNLIELSYCHQP